MPPFIRKPCRLRDCCVCATEMSNNRVCVMGDLIGLMLCVATTGRQYIDVVESVSSVFWSTQARR